jgi:hypothetical protein
LYELLGRDGTVHRRFRRCAHCGVPIVDEDTMQSRGDLAFCCANCASVHERGARGQQD